MPSIEDFQRVAIEEAKLALAKGNMPIGCVIVCDGEIVGRAHNTVDSDRSDLGHAEMNALRKVEHLLFGELKGRCEIYCTLEPCLMCYGALANHRIKRLVYSVSDLHAGYSRAAQLPAYYAARKFEVVTGVLKEEVLGLLKSYVAKTGHRAHLLASLI